MRSIVRTKGICHFTQLDWRWGCFRNNSPSAILALRSDVWCLRERCEFLYDLVNILDVTLISQCPNHRRDHHPPPSVPLLLNNTVVRHCVILAGASCGIRPASWLSVSRSSGPGTVQWVRLGCYWHIQVHSHSWEYIIAGNIRAAMLLKDLSDMVSMVGQNGYLPRGNAAVE